MHFQLVCRICLREGTMSSIFETQEEFGEKLIPCTDMLLACATVTVSASDGYPSKICDVCFKNLCAAYKFRRLCEESFSVLLKYSSSLAKTEIKEEKNDICDSFYNVPLKNESNEDLLPIQKEEDYYDEQNTSHFSECLDVLIDEKKSPKQSEEENKTTKGSKRNLTKKHCGTLKKGKLKKKRNSQVLTCSICPKSFKLKHLLDAHTDFHFGIKRYFCEICKKCYRSEKEHVRIHQRGNTHKCSTCDRSFSKKDKLKAHMETHSTNREKMVCGVEGCEKTFISMGGLERHRINHTALKNFICHLCSKSFIDKYQLETHIRMHTKERPHNCRFCSKGFVTSSARISHERWHTNTKNYQCAHCDKSFVTSSGRNRHNLIHSKEQMQNCRFCGKTFSRYDNKKHHEKTIHGVSDEKVSSDIQSSAFN